MLTISETAAHFRVTENTVKTWIDSGELAAINVGCGKKRARWRISTESLNAFEKKRTRGGPKVDLSNIRMIV